MIFFSLFITLFVALPIFAAQESASIIPANLLDNVCDFLRVDVEGQCEFELQKPVFLDAIRRGMTPIRAAAFRGQTEKVESLAADGAPCDDLGIFLLATHQGHCATVQSLFDLAKKKRALLREVGGVDGTTLLIVNQTLFDSSQKRTESEIQNECLRVAAYQGHQDIVQCLLRDNIEINMSEPGRKTAFQLAALRGNHVVLKQLLKYEAGSLDLQYESERIPTIRKLFDFLPGGVVDLILRFKGIEKIALTKKRKLEVPEAQIVDFDYPSLATNPAGVMLALACAQQGLDRVSGDPAQQENVKQCMTLLKKHPDRVMQALIKLLKSP